MAVATTPPLLCSAQLHRSSIPMTSKSSLSLQKPNRPCKRLISSSTPKWLTCSHSLRKFTCLASKKRQSLSVTKGQADDDLRRVVQIVLWLAVGLYILWLFLLPYAPGDPVWAISKETVDSLVGLSLNFFFILPFMNAADWKLIQPEDKFLTYYSPMTMIPLAIVVGIQVIESPVLHPMSEGLFNFVIGWTLIFAPLLFTDSKRDRYRGSLDLLWGLQMFLTNTFLIPYMAIRLSEPKVEDVPDKPSQLGSVMINGAPIVGLAGGAVCLISVFWALYGRMDGSFGSISDRWEFFLSYIGSERLAYAFIWDICFYAVFQPWLIGDNLRNIQEAKVNMVKNIRFVPVVGLVAYCLYLKPGEEL